MFHVLILIFLRFAGHIGPSHGADKALGLGVWDPCLRSSLQTPWVSIDPRLKIIRKVFTQQLNLSFNNSNNLKFNVLFNVLIIYASSMLTWQWWMGNVMITENHLNIKISLSVNQSGIQSNAQFEFFEIETKLNSFIGRLNH